MFQRRVTLERLGDGPRTLGADVVRSEAECAFAGRWEWGRKKKEREEQAAHHAQANEEGKAGKATHERYVSNVLLLSEAAMVRAPFAAMSLLWRLRACSRGGGWE